MRKRKLEFIDLVVATGFLYVIFMIFLVFTAFK